jgi:hypothetical protein
LIKLQVDEIDELINLWVALCQQICRLFVIGTFWGQALKQESLGDRFMIGLMKWQVENPLGTGS